ncbi:hypothetical protein NWI01_15500 [Nitrobacter winogradskyi]|uniref:Uncharacterized protein n=1 Tax=Nitrobacter winogradskyi TaxID=913 RepID=A0A4Y3WAX9_NITWI|nr:hypothetical protein NWI01_15500 [Nitrobacter winogradskyi]
MADGRDTPRGYGTATGAKSLERVEMIVGVPAGDLGKGNRGILGTGNLERPKGTMAATLSLNGDRRSRGGDA